MFDTIRSNMKKITSYYPVLCVDDVKTSSEFFKKNFQFEAGFESDWYVHLHRAEQESEVNIALVKKDHDSVPKSMQKSAQGILINFEFEEVDELYQHFLSEKFEILTPLRDEPWGQRHFILGTPFGIMIDIIKFIQPSEEFITQYSEQFS